MRPPAPAGGLLARGSYTAGAEGALDRGGSFGAAAFPGNDRGY